MRFARARALESMLGARLSERDTRDVPKTGDFNCAVEKICLSTPKRAVEL